MNRHFVLISAAISGFLSVAIGAFAAHALRGQLDSRALEIFATAHDYHISHSLLLLFIGLFMLENSTKKLQLSATFILIGLLLFSGSLYLLAVSGIRWLGMITPLGGIFLLAGWLLLVLGFVSTRKA